MSDPFAMATRMINASICAYNIFEDGAIPPSGPPITASAPPVMTAPSGFPAAGSSTVQKVVPFPGSVAPSFVGEDDSSEERVARLREAAGEVLGMSSVLGQGVPEVLRRVWQLMHGDEGA